MEPLTSENITNEFLYINQSQWISNGSNIVFQTGSVGIGTSLPRANLDVYGSINALAVNTSNIYGPIVGSNLVSALNVYASNAVSASNLFGNLVGSNLVSALNVYASNAVSASNLFGNLVGSNTISSSNILIASGLPSSIVLGSNVFVFSNAYGFSNVILMNSTGQVGIGTTSATTTLQVNGQISSFGKSGFGVCPPLVARQGVAGGTNWNPYGGTQGNFNLTSGSVQMQAGSNTMPASPTTITFPVAYTNNPIVLITAYSTTASSNPWVSAITTSSFNVTWTNFGTFEWIAIGI